MPNASGTGKTQTYESDPYDERLGGSATLNLLTATELFSGDIDAVVAFRFLQVLRANGTAEFCGLGRIVGTVGSRNGSFVIRSEGELRGDVISGTWWIVENSGTEELVGIRGTGTFKRRVGEDSTWKMDYEIDEPGADR